MPIKDFDSDSDSYIKDLMVNSNRETHTTHSSCKIIWTFLHRALQYNRHALYKTIKLQN